MPPDGFTPCLSFRCLMPPTPNLTVLILLVCFIGVLLAFFVSAGCRWWVARRQPATPPPLPVGKVAVSPYHRIDWLWMGFIVLTYASLSIGSAQLTDHPAELTISAEGLIQQIGFQLILAGMTVVVMVWRIGPVAWLGLCWPTWRRVLWIAPLSLVAMWSLNIALAVLGYSQWMDSLGVEPIQDSVKLLQENGDPVILGLMAVAAVLVAPVCEEILFRGYLYAAAKRFAGPWVAGIGASLIFAAAHGGLAPLLPLFVFGGLLVLAYEFTGSLWAPIGMHFCLNGATVLFQFVVRWAPLPDSL